MPRHRASAQGREQYKLKRSERRCAERARLLSLARRVIFAELPHRIENVIITPKAPLRESKPTEIEDIETRFASPSSTISAVPEEDDILQIDGYEFTEEKS